MRQKQERRREKLVFVLFIVLSLVFHAVLLLFIASGSSLPAKKAQHKDMTAIKVAPVNLPPSEPPSEEPPESQTPPSKPPSSPAWTPPPTAKPKDKPLDKPKDRPISSPKPQLTPKPQPTTTPTPSPKIPTAEEVKEIREKIALKKLIEVAKKDPNLADLKIDENYKPPEGQTIEDILKLLAPEEQAKMNQEAETYMNNRFGPIHNTGVKTNTPASSSASPEASTDPSANPGPEVSGDPKGTPDGDPKGSGTGGGFNLPGLDLNLNIKNKFDELDQITNPDLKNLSEKDLETDPLKNAENDLNDKQLKDNDFKLNLQPPSPSANPLKMDYKENAFGLLFSYDGNDFRATYPTDTYPKLAVSYYPRGSRPQDGSKGFELDWVVEWATNRNALVAAVVAQYDALKKAENP